MLSSPTAVVPDVVVALVAGLAIRNLAWRPTFEPGAQFTVRYVLRAAIVLLGSLLSITQVVVGGVQDLVLVVLVVATSMCLGLVLVRVLGVPRRVGILVGAGTAICGATAILVIGPLLKARAEETSYAIGTIFGFNLLAMLTYPLIGHLLGMGQVAFGTWAGTGINDTSVVIATGLIYGSQAVGVAVLIKLVRPLLLLPLAVVIGLVSAGRAPSVAAARAAVPWFILGFVALSLLHSAGVITDAEASVLGWLARFLVVMVLAGVGLGTDLRALAGLGWRPLVTGLILGATMGGLTLAAVEVLRLA